MSPFLLSLLSLTNIIEFIVFFFNYNYNIKTNFVRIDLDHQSFITNFSNRTNYLSVNNKAIKFNSAIIIIYIGLLNLAYVIILLKKIFIKPTGDTLILNNTSFDNNYNSDYPVNNFDNFNKDLNYFKNSLSNNNTSLFDFWLLIKYIKKKIYLINNS
jgi:hypothetical protein